jgi:hypothetical protein
VDAQLQVLVDAQLPVAEVDPALAQVLLASIERAMEIDRRFADLDLGLVDASTFGEVARDLIGSVNGSGRGATNPRRKFRR